LKKIFKNNKDLLFVNIDEISQISNQRLKHSILVNLSSEKEIKKIVLLLKEIINIDCSEIYCVGMCAEKLHDELDNIIEELELLNIVTTWSENESIEEIYFYFLHVASLAASLLYVINANIQFENYFEQQ
jgi:MFS superfamily sulfate permease-like transporter